MFICGFTALCITTSTAASVTLTDDLGRKVELDAPAQRIVTLAPFLTELAFSVGAGAKVVAVSAYSDYPPEVRALPEVGSAIGFDVEAIAALHPDLVLVWTDSVRREDIERIERFGAAVFAVKARELADVPRALRAIGALTGHEVEPLVARYDARIGELRHAHAGARRLATLLEIWDKPLTTIGGRHFMNEALEICGARNVFADAGGVAPQIGLEEVYRRDPDLIVWVSSASDAGFRAQWRGHATLAAVKAGRLVAVEADRMQRLTLRTPEGIASLCDAIDRVR